jgi:chromosome segregation ATPase
VKEYKNKIKTLNFQKLKAVENKNFMLWNYELKEKELNNLKEEIQSIKNKINFNKDTLINQLTSQFSQMELSNKELNVTVQNLKDDFTKYNKTFEMYSANTNKHNNKEALLITLNRENNEKLDEKHLLEQTINKLKQIFKNKKNEPVDITEISFQNENDLRNIKQILLTNIGKMKNELENNKYNQNTDNNENLPLKRQFEKYYAQFKTLLSKQNRELEYLKEINVKKEAQIASLNRKIENIKQEIYFKSPHKSITDTKIKFNKLSFSPSKQIEN